MLVAYIELDFAARMKFQEASQYYRPHLLLLLQFLIKITLLINQSTLKSNKKELDNFTGDEIISPIYNICYCNCVRYSTQIRAIKPTMIISCGKIHMETNLKLMGFLWFWIDNTQMV